jgi:hypothetical protein
MITIPASSWVIKYRLWIWKPTAGVDPTHSWEPSARFNTPVKAPVDEPMDAPVAGLSMGKLAAVPSGNRSSNDVVA